MKIEKHDDSYMAIFDKPREDGVSRVIFTARTIASWSALLGLEDTKEAIAAIMTARESRDSYDPKTGRNAWTGAYEALEATLRSASAPSSFMAVESAQNAPSEPNNLIDAYNRTRKALGLGLIKPPTSGAFFVLENSQAQPHVESGSGIDTSCVDSNEVAKLEADEDFQKEIQDAAEAFYKSLMPQDRRNNG